MFSSQHPGLKMMIFNIQQITKGEFVEEGYDWS